MNEESVTRIKPDECAGGINDIVMEQAMAAAAADDHKAVNSRRLDELDAKLNDLLMGIGGDLSMLQARVKFLEDFVCELLGCERAELLRREAEMHSEKVLLAYRVRSGIPVVETNPTITRFGKPFSVKCDGGVA